MEAPRLTPAALAGRRLTSRPRASGVLGPGIPGSYGRSGSGISGSPLIQHLPALDIDDFAVNRDLQPAGTLERSSLLHGQGVAGESSEVGRTAPSMFPSGFGARGRFRQHR
jgi:hypothetical protein